MRRLAPLLGAAALGLLGRLLQVPGGGRRPRLVGELREAGKSIAFRVRPS